MGKRRKQKQSGSSPNSAKRARHDTFTTPEGETMPMRLKKYWNQRHNLFARFDEGIQIDEEGWYSVTPELIAYDTAERIAQLYNPKDKSKYGRFTVVDAFCGVGGNAIQFAEWCEHVIAIDIDPTRLAMAKNNAEVYGVSDRIEFILGDFYQLAPMLQAQVVFMSPPWGGPEYLDSSVYDLGKMPFHTAQEWIDQARVISPNIVYFMPRNCDPRELADLCPESSCDIEMNYMGAFFKSITVYYGDLALYGSSQPLDSASAAKVGHDERQYERLVRSIDACERQLAENAFSEPLDVAQVRLLTSIEHIVDEHKHLLTADSADSIQRELAQRLEEIERAIHPWAEKRDALLKSLDPQTSGDEEENTAGETKEKREIKGEQLERSPASSIAAAAATTPALSETASTHKRRSSAADRRAELLGEMDGLRRRGAVPNSVEGVERLLKSQRATQDDLSSDLLKMASILKKNSLAFGDLIEKDRDVVDSAAEKLDANLANMEKHGGRLDKFRKRSWGTTGLTWLTVLVVVSVFFMLVLFMRVAPKRY
ncbi:Trimethylguanosine synthase [Coemansia erecta]|uniref:Trimethylguanosine synthase n=1 Tax=Coemansia erecta TaxID=147472 RepID=A0A9W7Y3F5_9FUNG|nr:Trimethylguanosine synthase [Coemansia erecta]